MTLAEALAESQFENRRTFAEWGEAALFMMIDKGPGDPELPDEGISLQEFQAKYGVEKKVVNFVLSRLQIAIEKGDYNTRNELYDFFIEILRNGKYGKKENKLES